MFFFFNDTATTEIYTLSLHDALPILLGLGRVGLEPVPELLVADPLHEALDLGVAELGLGLALELRVADLHRDDRRQALADVLDRKSTRLNSSHANISYAVFCLKKKNK